ncbi:hypothetical protein [Methylobacterium trifolii]|uniref:Proteophosphoglycan ppg4 n=1 Tax=Methylobacterium trifolii TaxID=1003092 RepID=A0ABQ4TUM0_9HYPH|nr:hypothetical protein [Methylobacterium trifolii]GJE58487.1 hypothetical protein MPOCJGCO_0568 [Methylobacterium trifolii]
MRYAALMVAGALLTASPVLAQDAGNVGQPSRAVPQAGQTTGGPIDTPPGAGGSMSTGSVSRPAGEMGMSPGAGAVDSAKGGNADQTNKPVPNAGTTSGGPAR